MRKLLLCSLLLVPTLASAQAIRQTRAGGTGGTGGISWPIYGTTPGQYIRVGSSIIASGMFAQTYVAVATMTTQDLVVNGNAYMNDTFVNDVYISGFGSVQQALATLSGMAMMKVDGGPCPSGWTEWTTPGGYFLVAGPSGGTYNGTVGAAMADLSDTTHTHDVTTVSNLQAGTTGGNVVQDGGNTLTSTGVNRSAVAPYFQVRLCIVP